MSLSAANDHARLPIADRLYLPQEWADAPDRRVQAGVPDDVVFQTKPQIALDQLRAARAAGIDAAVVLADAGYGNDTDFRDGITGIGLAYAVGIQSSTSLWPPGVEPLPPKPYQGKCNRNRYYRRNTGILKMLGGRPVGAISSRCEGREEFFKTACRGIKLASCINNAFEP